MGAGGIAEKMRILGVGRGERRKGNWSTRSTPYTRRHARAGTRADLHTHWLTQSLARQGRERKRERARSSSSSASTFGIGHFAQRGQVDNQATAHMLVRATDPLASPLIIRLRGATKAQSLAAFEAFFAARRCLRSCSPASSSRTADSSRIT